MLNPDSSKLKIFVRLRPIRPRHLAPDGMTSLNELGVSCTQHVSNDKPDSPLSSPFHIPWRWTSTKISHLGWSSEASSCGPANGNRTQETRKLMKGNGISMQQFDCHRVFKPHESTSEIFQSLVPLLHDMTRTRQNLCIAAYGQTDTGKTYTLFGTEAVPGIFRLAAETLLGVSRAKFSLSVSAVEVYNEQIRDLVDPRAPVVVLQEAKEKICSRIIQISSVTEICNIMNLIQIHRFTGITDAHSHASRSHCIASLHLMFSETDQVCLQIVDLAGSENAEDPYEHPSKNMNILHGSFTWFVRSEEYKAHKRRTQEGSNIRKSLLALTRCVHTLASLNHSHVPYRDSKLTRILKTVLSGSGVLALICTADPSNYRGTLSTLRFADSVLRMLTNRDRDGAGDLAPLLAHCEEEIKILEESAVLNTAEHIDNLQELTSAHKKKLSLIESEAKNQELKRKTKKADYKKLFYQLESRTRAPWRQTPPLSRQRTTSCPALLYGRDTDHHSCRSLVERQNYDVGKNSFDAIVLSREKDFLQRQKQSVERGLERMRNMDNCVVDMTKNLRILQHEVIALKKRFGYCNTDKCVDDSFDPSSGNSQNDITLIPKLHNMCNYLDLFLSENRE